MIDFMEKETNDKEFLEYIVKALVDHPEDVQIERKVDEMGVLLSLKVNSEDMGQIVGRGGATARAIRSLVRIVGLKNHARVNLKIEEPEGGRAPARERSSEASPERSPEASSEGSLEDLKI
jgi:predicted RNA-binding protein YlqC (UPF0109 family)